MTFLYNVFLQCESYEKFRLAWNDIKDVILERVLLSNENQRKERIFMELNDKVYDEIKQRSARGNELADSEYYREALN